MSYLNINESDRAESYEKELETIKNEHKELMYELENLKNQIIKTIKDSHSTPSKKIEKIKKLLFVD